MPSTNGELGLDWLMKAFAPDFAERIDLREALLRSENLSAPRRDVLRTEIKTLYFGGIIKMNVLLYRSNRKRR